MQVLSPRAVFQEAFVKVTKAAWGDSAPGSPPAQLQPVLQCFSLQPGTTRSQLHWDRGGGCSALCSVTVYDGNFTANVHCLAPAARTRPQQGCGLFQCRLSLCKAATRILSVPAINKAPFASGVGLVTPLGYKKGLCVPSSTLSKSDASQFTT